MSNYWDKYRDKRTAYSNNIRALKIGAVGTFTKEEWIEMCRKHDNRCVACNVQGQMTVDHIVPLSRGGSNDVSNLQPLCKSCNSKKGIRIRDENAHKRSLQAQDLLCSGK